MVTIAQQSRIEQLVIFFIESIGDVCAAMLNCSSETEPRSRNTNHAPCKLNKVNGSIGFGGHITESILFSCSKKRIGEMARAVLGQENPPEARELADDGERTNMLAGGCKSRLSELNEGLQVRVFAKL